MVGETFLPLTAKRPKVPTQSSKYAAVIDILMKPPGCAPYPQTRRHPRAAAGPIHPSMHDAPIYARCTHLCTSKRYDSKADELLLGTDAVDVVVKATVTRAGQIAAATENSIAEPAPSTAETSAGSSRFLPVVGVTSSRARCRERPCSRRAAEQRDELAAPHGSPLVG